MPEALEINPHKKWTFSIDNIEYTITVFLSVHLYTTYQSAIEKGNSGKEAIAHTLFETLNSYEDKQPTYEKLLSNEDILNEYALQLVDSSDALYDEYLKTSESDIVFTRFQSAMKNYVKATLGDIIEASQINVQEISNALSSMVNVLPTISNATAQAIKKLLDFSDLVKPVVSGISSMISSLADSALSNISAMISEIKTPTISQERKQELLKSYIAWGEYGWSVLPCAPIDIYNEIPLDANVADKIALSYLHKDDMEMLFEKLKNNKMVKQSDLLEAIWLYKNKHYKVCSMILFSMIDAKLVRLQDKSSRSVGKTAILRFEDKLESNKRYKDLLIYLLQYSNAIACLKYIYATYNNFQNEPDLVNRNFVMHGMTTKNIRKKDCKQLFVLYWNLIGLSAFLK